MLIAESWVAETTTSESKSDINPEFWENPFAISY